ncbi:MAG: glycosyltransferase family 2 protein [Lysobacter sp.]|nr:glycosyltransferase family 2 protein [Lysobacter sp.]
MSEANATAAPLVSVALCTYNGAAYLGEQLESLLGQHGVRIEIVAVDDGSQDGTRAILRDYAARDARVRCFENARNLGPTASFERAMSLCRGDFIAPSDQDDVWEPDKLARLLDAIDGCDTVYCDSAYIHADGRPTGRRISDGMAMLEGTNPIAFLFANSVSGHAMLLRRALFERARPFPEGAYHDWWLALCAAGIAGIRYVDQPLVRFRRHEDAFSPMGRVGRASSREAAPSLAWLEQRHRLMAAYGETGLRRSAEAGALADALRQAIDHGRTARLAALLWRMRAVLPRWSGFAPFDAGKMFVRLLRKLRRARRTSGASEPASRQ